MNIGIIGYGSMGKMLLESFVRSENVTGGILIANRTREKIGHLSSMATVCGSNADLASRSDIIIMCVRPVDIRTVLEDIRDEIRPDTILISLNGSVSFGTIGKILRCKTCKVIPSLTAETGRSQTLVCHNDLMNDSDKETVKTLFECMGNVTVLPENEMGMGSELVSCMPGFIASVFDVICDSAKKHTSIPEEQIVSMVLNTLCATGELMIDKRMTFEEVVDRVATKGGITEEGTKVIYEKFPAISDELFEKTLEKRRLTARKAEEAFG